MAESPSVLTGSNVKAEMARKGVNQTALAVALGISQPQVSARLRGVVPFDVNELHAVAAFLGVPIATLLPAPAVAKAAS